MMKNAHAYNERRGIGNNVANATFSMHAFFPGRRFSARALVLIFATCASAIQGRIQEFSKGGDFCKGGGGYSYIV